MKIPKYLYGEKFEYYDSIVSKRLIYIENIGYFLINEVAEHDDGMDRNKEIHCYSLESELSFKKINLFDGTYKFYDPLNTENSLLHKILLTTNWKIGNVDTDLWNLYRTFEIPDSTVYEFLMNEVENSYECVFIFDSINREVSAHTLGNLTKKTDIYISYNNLISSITITEKADEIVTALSVYGGNDLGIASVNPLGTNTIYNFSYFMNKEWMTESLVNSIKNWETKISESKDRYSSLLLSFKNTNAEITEEKSKLEDLKAERDSIEGVVKAMIEGDQKNTEEYRNKVNELNKKNEEIKQQENKINNIQSEADSIQNLLKEINNSLSFSNNFTNDEYEELKSYMIENTYQNSSYITTSDMNNEEIQDMAQELYDVAYDVLKRVSQPRFEFSLESINFIFLKEFKEFTDQLELGCIVNIEKEDNYIITPILLSMTIQLDDPTNFSMEFGNKYRLDTSDYKFSDLFGDAISAGSSVKFDGAKWGEYVNSGMNNTVSDFINSALDTSKNNLINAKNQEIVINQNGLRGKMLQDNGNYSPNQVWLTSSVLAFTSDNWNSVRLAIGEIEANGSKFFGIVGDALVGKIIAGNQLQITNDNNNFILDSNGAVLNNASFTVVSNNNRTQISLNPEEGISIETRDSISSSWKNKFYVDSSGNLIIDGKITANSGSIGGWSISSDRLYNSKNGDYIGSNGSGKLSLLSWTPSSATFNGKIYASNLGDQIKTGNIQNGAVTAAKLDTVYATKVFVDEMNAELARVHTLAANKVDANYVSANYATIGSLNSTNARIDSLYATKLDSNLILSSSGNLSIYANIVQTRGGFFTGAGVQASRFVLIDGVSQWNFNSSIPVKDTSGRTVHCLGYY